MATLKQVENAMNGEPEIVIDSQEPVLQVAETKVDFVLFKLANSNKDGGVHIPGIDYVIDPRTITKDKPNGNGPELIRLVQGATSIWAKEQKDLDEKYVKKNLRFISFPRGSKFIKVPDWDTMMIEWMRMSRHNIKNPHRKGGTKTEYFEYDPNEQAKALLDKEQLEIEVVVLASQQSIEKIRPHAFYLGIKFDDDYGIPKPESRLKAEYILAAKRDPKRFKETIDSEEVNIQFLLRKAIVDGKIDISKGDGFAYWAGGVKICSMPKNDKPLKVLTELAMLKNKEGKDFKDKLNQIAT